MSKNIIKQYKNGSSRSSNKDSSKNKIIIYVIITKKNFYSYLLYCFNINIEFNKSKQYPNFFIAALAYKCIK